MSPKIPRHEDYTRAAADARLRSSAVTVASEEAVSNRRLRPSSARTAGTTIGTARSTFRLTPAVPREATTTRPRFLPIGRVRAQVEGSRLALWIGCGEQRLRILAGGGKQAGGRLEGPRRLLLVPLGVVTLGAWRR